ncbi:transcriptional regulator GcvA [Dongia deserti]|uniref:transcriptional regulator GcvA n=1 Tax=Dongia deserti TaxID=2268030 RepID=UPI000E64929B|nr:transcriptional regulator GcvA [Dongia deserti]
MKRNLPPLNALRAFEASARLSSMQRAAHELNVTPSAISQQVQNLEQWLGFPLLERRARQVQPTAQGRTYLAAISGAFDQIAAATAELSAGAIPRSICITCTPGFAVQWLVPRLQQFQDLHADIDVRIDASTRLIDLRGEDVDLAVRHGTGRYPGLVSEKLLDDDLIPVASPRLLTGRGRIRKPADLLHHRLLHIETRDDWRLWFAAQGMEIDWRRGPLLIDTAIGVQAAVAGKGVILVRRSLIADELASNRLVAPLPQGLSKGMAYYLVYPPENMGRPAVRAFRAWLLEAVGAGSLPEPTAKPHLLQSRV